MRGPADDLDARRPVWAALSAMFVDGDVEATRTERAAAIAASPYAMDEVDRILAGEVYPACWTRLSAEPEAVSSPADPAWLEARILRWPGTAESHARLVELAALAIPRSREWLATRAAVEALRQGRLD